MAGHDDVVRLNQELADTKVLSVYLNAEETDPAARRAWRVRLNGMLKTLEGEMANLPERERRAAREAAALLDHELEEYRGMLPSRGWFGFATADRVWHASPTAAPMPNLVRWTDGAHVAPYVRALKQSRPVRAVLVDRQQARVFSYVHGALEEEETLRADALGGPTSSAGISKRPSTHSGTRGAPRTDSLKRLEDAASQRLLQEVAGVVSRAASAEDLLVFAGAPETTGALLGDLPEPVRARAIEVPGLRIDATAAQVREAIDAAASALSIRMQRALVDEVIEATRSAGRACLGREQAGRALQAGAVDTLLLTRAFAQAQPDVAEGLVDQAFAQGAAVEEISEAAAAALDAEGGIGARLRFAV